MSEGIDNSTIEAPAWELSKENVIPLKTGRNARSLTTALQNSHDTEHTAKLEKEKSEFEVAIAENANAEDPLRLWTSYVRWIQESFPATSLQNHLLPVLERATRSFKDNANYINDKRYITLWIKYADMVSEPAELFLFMYNNGIGLQVALFYEAWATITEASGNYSLTDRIFTEGVNRGALPIDRLRKRHREFEHRMKKRWLSMHEEAAQPFALPRDENERRSRYAMTSLSEEAAKCLHRSLSTNEQQNGGLDIAKVAPRSNKTLEVFVDPDLHPGNSDLSRLPDSNGMWNTLGTQQQRHKENRATPSVWTDTQLPKYSHLETGDRNIHSTPKFHVFVDEDCNAASNSQKPVIEHVDPRSLLNTEQKFCTIDPEVLRHDPLRLFRDSSTVHTPIHKSTRSVMSANRTGSQRKGLSVLKDKVDSGIGSTDTEHAQTNTNDSAPPLSTHAVQTKVLEQEKIQRKGKKSKREAINENRVGYSVKMVYPYGEDEEDLCFEEARAEIWRRKNREVDIGVTNEQNVDSFKQATNYNDNPGSTHACDGSLLYHAHTRTPAPHACNTPSTVSITKRLSFETSSTGVSIRSRNAVKSIVESNTKSSARTQNQHEQRLTEKTSDEENDERDDRNEREESEYLSLKKADEEDVTINTKFARQVVFGMFCSPQNSEISSKEKGIIDQPNKPHNELKPVWTPHVKVDHTNRLKPTERKQDKSHEWVQDENVPVNNQQKQNKTPFRVFETSIECTPCEVSEAQKKIQSCALEAKFELDSQRRIPHLQDQNENSECKPKRSRGLNSAPQLKQSKSNFSMQNNSETPQNISIGAIGHAQISTHERQRSDENGNYGENNENDENMAPQGTISFSQSSSCHPVETRVLAPITSIPFDEHDAFTVEYDPSDLASPIKNVRIEKKMNEGPSVRNHNERQFGAQPSQASAHGGIMLPLGVILETSREDSSFHSGRTSSSARNSSEHSTILEHDLALTTFSIISNVFSATFRRSLMDLPQIQESIASDTNLYHFREPTPYRIGRLIGQTIELHGNRIHIERELGQGSFGKVYSVLDLQRFTDSSEDDEITVALKVQQPAHIWEYIILQKIQHRIARNAKHHYVCPISLDVYQDCSFFLMEQRSHVTLQNLLNLYMKNDKRMEESVVIFYTIELLRAVEYLHGMDILHCDIKPDNILVLCGDMDEEWEAWSPSRDTEMGPILPAGWMERSIVLIDFGSSIDMSLHPNCAFIGDSNTSAFRCIEMQQNMPWRWQVDLYSIASTIHTLLHHSYLEVKQIENGLWVPKTKLKRYWNTNLWSTFFKTLLNPEIEGITHLSSTDLPLLRNLRYKFERYLAENPIVSRDLKVHVCKQSVWLYDCES